jgi:hypothetical protein
MDIVMCSYRKPSFFEATSPVSVTFIVIALTCNTGNSHTPQPPQHCLRMTDSRKDQRPPGGASFPDDAAPPYPGFHDIELQDLPSSRGLEQDLQLPQVTGQ